MTVCFIHMAIHEGMSQKVLSHHRTYTSIYQPYEIFLIVELVMFLLRLGQENADPPIGLRRNQNCMDLFLFCYPFTNLISR